MYVCEKCDTPFPKWSGRCPECQAWGTIKETAQQHQGSVGPSTFQALPRLSKPLERAGSERRIVTKNTEYDRVLGGGIVPGSLLLLSGEPGIGKSTLVASLAVSLPGSGTVLYASGEESADQLSGRFERLGKPFEKVRYLETGDVESLAATIEKEKPLLAIIDSVQTLGSVAVEGTPGSPGLVRYAANLLLQTAKRTGIPILLIGQVTKDGTVAGPKTMEHLVDTVLSLEGDPMHAFRILRATKNRFGSTEEVGVFEMGGAGLIPVPNPSERFLAERVATPGSIITAALEGSRVFLIEVQALVEKSSYATPIRRASGFDANRLQMLCAILSKRLGVHLGDQDVYINVVGGMRLEEPAADLAVCAAILSAISGISMTEPTIYIGEVGLGGEVRSVPACDRRLSEAARMGIQKAVLPKRNSSKPMKGLVSEGIQTLSQLKRTAV